ncbi:MAG: thiol reductant ABC exporter subunit CydD [Anaerolineales bacterium]|nr:thiol reductant ABC exporter subunit CydD [Anaerolineales bacterium]
MVNKRLLALARSSRTALYVTILAGFLSGFLIIGQAWNLSQSVEAIFLDGQTLSDISATLQRLLYFIVGRAFMVWLGEISAGSLARRVKTALRERLYRHLINLGPGYVRGERTGELINTMVEGVEALDAWFSGYLPQLVLAALLPLTFLFFVFPRDFLTGLVLLLTAPLIPIFMILIGNLADALTRKQWKFLGRMSAHFLDVLQGLTTLKILGRSRAQIEVIKKVSGEFRKTTLGVLRVAFLSALVLEMVATLSTAVVAVEIGLRLLYGRMAFQDAFFVLLLAPEFYLPLRMLGTRFHAGVAGVAAAERIFEVLDSRPKTEDRRPVFPVSCPPSSVCFNNVSYTYPDGRTALKDVSFTIEPGEKVALVGPSGAGKSTVAHLLLGFMEPEEGEIASPSLPCSPAPSPSTEREQDVADRPGGEVAWLPQHPYLFNDTIAANIRLACPGAGMDEVIAAAQAARAHEFIKEMGHGFPRTLCVPSANTDENSKKQIRVHPCRRRRAEQSVSKKESGGTYSGYETIIGERGARLSGGQIQRIALARAFLMDAPFVILDEPTSHLDPELETQIQESTNQLLEGRTALIIAHRLQTVIQADKIIVLDEGRIVGQGSHDELIANTPLYVEMVGKLQVASYKLHVAPHHPIRPTTFNQQPETEFSRSTHHSPRSTLSPPPSTLPRLLSFLAGSWNWVTLSVLFGFATIASSIGLLGASAYIISAAALQPSIAVLQVPIVGVRFFGIARGVFRYLERLVSHQVTFRLLARLRVWFYDKLEPLAPARLGAFRSGDLLSRVIADIDTLENFYIRALAPPLVALCVALLSGGLLARYDWRLTLALWITLALAGILLPWLARRLARGVGRDQISARAALNVALVDGIQGMPDLLAFGRGEDQMRIVNMLGDDLSQAQKRSSLVDGLRAALMNLLTNLGMWTVLVLAIPLVSAGQLDGVYLATITLIALSAFEAVLPLSEAAQHLDENIEAARRLFEIVDAQPEVVDPPRPLPAPKSFDITVKNISFRYPQTQYPISNIQYPTSNLQQSTLNQISFEIPPGAHLAIVGPSGVGKTTILHLLLRFWAFQDGEILLGGRDLRAYRQEDVRSIFGVVSQDTHLFNATVRENLLIARPNATDEQIVRAAQQAQIHQFIDALPDGYNTWIGEQGFKLSGGERQRLSLARALLKDTPILLLDEPTAHLDPLTGQVFMRSLREISSGRSIVIITHQLNNLDWMDEILVLRQGQIIERGTHRNLLDRDGFYQRMWRFSHQRVN